MSVINDGGTPAGAETLDAAAQSRKEKRKALKKQKRKQIRRELAIREREEEETRANDPEEQLRVRLREQEEAEAAERERKAFEERERLWLEAAAARRAEEEHAEEEARRKGLLRESQKDEVSGTEDIGETDDWEYVEEGPAEIIWKGNEIIVKKKQIRVPRRGVGKRLVKEGDDRPTSNPLPPQSVAFDAFNNLPPGSAQEVLESVSQKVPNFGTEQCRSFGRTKLIAPFISRLGLVVLGYVAAGCISILISPAQCLLRTCTTALVLHGSKMRGSRQLLQGSVCWEFRLYSSSRCQIKRYCDSWSPFYLLCC